VPANGHWQYSVAGKITVSLALHRPCVKDCVLSIHGLSGLRKFCVLSVYRLSGLRKFGALYLLRRESNLGTTLGVTRVKVKGVV